MFRVVCTMTSTPCDGFTWTDKTGNLPDIPVDSIIVNPNYPSQVFAGTDFGLYYTDDITANPPVWNRFNNGLPNVMIWDMSVDRGSTTLALWTRSRGAYAWPLPTGPENGPAGPATMSTPAASSTLTGNSVNFTWYPSNCGAGLLDRCRQHAGRQQLLPVRQPADHHGVADRQQPAHRWQYGLRHPLYRINGHG